MLHKLPDLRLSTVHLVDAHYFLQEGYWLELLQANFLCLPTGQSFRLAFVAVLEEYDKQSLPHLQLRTRVTRAVQES